MIRMAEHSDARTYWDRHAKNYDRSMRLLGGPVPRMIELVARSVAGAGEVLEIGAGTGIITVAVSRTARHVIATDYAPGMLARLEEHLRRDGVQNVETARADVDSLDFADGRFDAVIAANVLHLVPDMQSALRSMTRVLGPEGVLLVPTYCHGQTRTARLVSRLLGLTGFPGRRRLTMTTITNAVRAAGLRVTGTELLPGVLPIGFVSARR